MRIPGWQAEFSEYKSTIYYAGYYAGPALPPGFENPWWKQCFGPGGSIVWVDLSRNRQNCGNCGISCHYNQICCNGLCVPSNEEHCGWNCAPCFQGEQCCFKPSGKIGSPFF